MRTRTTVSGARRSIVLAWLAVAAGCGEPEMTPDAGTADAAVIDAATVDAASSSDASPRDAASTDDASASDGGALDAGTTPGDAGGGGADAGPLECSNATRWGLSEGDWCPSAIGEISGSAADCPAAPAGWMANHLAIGATTYCVYESDPPQMLPDFCTLPASRTGAPPWTWLDPDCVVTGP